MKYLLVNLFFIFSFAHAWAAGNITYEVTTGEKKIIPLNNFQSKLKYDIDAQSVKAHFSQFTFEEIKTGNKVMTLKVKRRSVIKYEYSDFDLSGKFEVVRKYSEGKIVSELKLHEPTKIILERTLFNSKGEILEVDNDLLKKGFFSERNIYKNGKIFKTLKDLNGDGLYEQEFIYFIDKKPNLTKYEQKLPDKKIPSNIKCVVGGFFHQATIATFDEELTREVVAALKGITNSNYLRTKSYVDLILKQEKSKKALGKKFVTRIDIYKAVNTVENKDSKEKLGLFIVSGKVFKTNSRVTVYFRFQGPLALATVYNGSFSQSIGNFNINEVAKFISKKLKERYMPVVDEKGNQTGYKLKKTN